MPLPDSHLKTLERHLARHEEALAALEAELAAIERAAQGPPRGIEFPKKPRPRQLQIRREEIEREMDGHQRLIAFGRDPRALDTLAELLDDPALARTAAVDPAGFARDRGIDVPEAMRLDLTVGDTDLDLRITHYDAHAPAIVLWSRDGFSEPV